MLNYFSIYDGSLLITVYGLSLIVLTSFFRKRYSTTKKQFLVANRSLGIWEASLSIAATWIWAPALFIASQKAYQQGIVGLFWFTVPNVLCLIIFAHFAKKIREKVPEGFTFSGYIKSRFSKRLQKLYIMEFSILAICSFAVQLLAGGKIFETLTGIPFVWVTIALAGITL